MASRRAPALALELVEGPTLADRLPHGPMTLAEAVAICRPFGNAIVSNAFVFSQVETTGSIWLLSPEPSTQRRGTNEPVLKIVSVLGSGFLGSGFRFGVRGSGS